MTIVVKKQASKKEIKFILEKLKLGTPKKNLRSVYGIFPIKEDAIDIQKQLRSEWD